MRQLSKFVALLLLPGALASAQQSRVYREGSDWVQETTGSLGSARNLRIRVDMGAVVVQGGAEQTITYLIHSRSNSSEESARREFDARKIGAWVHGDTAVVQTDWQGSSSPHQFTSDLVINIPRDIDTVKIETAGGSISAKGINGRLIARTGGGGIQVDDIGGSLSAETGGESIDVGSVGGDVKVRTGGGQIVIRKAAGKIDASTGGGDMSVSSGLQGAVLETGGGNISVQRCTGRLKVSTGGGNIDLGDIAGPVEIETGGGSIRLASAQGYVRAETGSGRIELNGVPSARAQTGAGAIVAKIIASPNGERADSLLETPSGDITVSLPPTLKISIRASIEVSNGQGIHSDFPDLKVRTEGGDWGPKAVSAEGSLNGGGPVLRLRTTNGDIYVRRANP